MSYQEPMPVNDQQIMLFSQVGPPRNLSLYINDNGDYVLSWERPEYGLDSLRYYILQWWKEPEHVLYGTVETPDYSYVVQHLREDVIYRFQVFSLSTTDYQSGSNEVTILVPPYNRIRMTTIGSAVGVACLIFAIAAIVYVIRNRRLK